MTLTAGKTLQNGKYLLGEVLRQDGLNVTYRANRSDRIQSVVIKTLKVGGFAQADFVALKQQFVEDARSFSQCLHPGLVRVLDIFEETGLPYVVMDYIPGRSLAKLVEHNGPLHEKVALQYMQQISSAIAALHQRGLVHRHIRPENMIQPPGANFVVLVDCGGNPVQVTEAQAAAMATMPNAFAALEQYRPKSRITSATDIYSLAASLYWILTGKQPVAAPLRQKSPLMAPRQLQPGISPTVEAAILSGLELSPQIRPAAIAPWFNQLRKRGDTQPPSRPSQVGAIAPQPLPPAAQMQAPPTPLAASPLTPVPATPTQATPPQATPTQAAQVAAAKSGQPSAPPKGSSKPPTQAAPTQAAPAQAASHPARKSQSAPAQPAANQTVPPIVAVAPPTAEPVDWATSHPVPTHPVPTHPAQAHSAQAYPVQTHSAQTQPTQLHPGSNHNTSDHGASDHRSSKHQASNYQTSKHQASKHQPITSTQRAQHQPTSSHSVPAKPAMVATLSPSPAIPTPKTIEKPWWRSLVKISAIATLAGFAFGLGLRMRSSSGPGSSFFHTEQAFPPIANWPTVAKPVDPPEPPRPPTRSSASPYAEPAAADSAPPVEAPPPRRSRSYEPEPAAPAAPAAPAVAPPTRDVDPAPSPASPAPPAPAAASEPAPVAVPEPILPPSEPAPPAPTVTPQSWQKEPAPASAPAPQP